MASVPLRFSTTSAGMLTENMTAKMMPGMISRISPPMTARPTRIEISSTLPNRAKPHL